MAHGVIQALDNLVDFLARNVPLCIWSNVGTQGWRWPCMWTARVLFVLGKAGHRKPCTKSTSACETAMAREEQSETYSQTQSRFLYVRSNLKGESCAYDARRSGDTMERPSFLSEGSMCDAYGVACQVA